MHFEWTPQAMFPPRHIYWTCAAKGLTTLTLFKDETGETDTLFKAQPEKGGQHSIQAKNNCVSHLWSLIAWSAELIFRLPGHFCTSILADTIYSRYAPVLCLNFKAKNACTCTCIYGLRTLETIPYPTTTTNLYIAYVREYPYPLLRCFL